MRLVRAFSSSACRSRQVLFELPDQTSREDKDFLLRRKRGAYTANPFIGKDSKVIRTAFHCEYSDLDQLRSQCALRIAAALAKLQDPKSFAVKDLTFDKIMGPPTISYPAEFVLIDHQNPLGVPPDTPKLAIPPIRDPSLVAKALSEAGFTGSFFQFQHQLNYDPLSHTENLPWPNYKHLPRGGYIYPPRLHITHQKLGTVTLTLPGATVLPLYKFFEWFHRDNRDFKTTNELVTLWARSQDIGLSPQAIALMVVSAMQTEKPFFIDRLELTGWSNVEYSNGGQWHQTVGSVHVDFNKVHSLPPAAHDINLLNFFMHWKGHHLKSRSFAFTVRNGRSNQLIPRQYTTDVPSYKGFFKSNMDDPTQEFPPWRYDRFVIQDPFLVTHNHAEHLPDGAYRKFGHHLLRTFDFLRAGRPLPWIFGTHAAPPGSDAETKILGDLDVYSTALNLLEKDRIPQDLGRWGGRNNLLPMLAMIMMDSIRAQVKPIRD
ncbi:hypothetical protein B0H13DRAFT_735380 [Mycena leptocephala]|nr:hypothetical protein B0H13DRAFT_735380 [Mycena leptocephala]